MAFKPFLTNSASFVTLLYKLLMTKLGTEPFWAKSFLIESVSILEQLERSGKSIQFPFGPHCQVALPDWPDGHG